MPTLDDKLIILEFHETDADVVSFVREAEEAGLALCGGNRPSPYNSR